MSFRGTAWRRDFLGRSERISVIGLSKLISLPLQMALTHAVRQLARERPEVFDRLGPAREAVFLLCPRGLPLAIRLELLGERSTVCFRPLAEAGGFTARISGPLSTLVGLFDGSIDADSAFFSRRIQVDGDTAAVTALHNVLDAAELSLLDLVPGPKAVKRTLRTPPWPGRRRYRRRT